MKATLVVVHKPMFLKPFHIERHYYEANGDIVQKVMLVGYEYLTRKEANQALGKLLNEAAE
jgi:hypothetical protein